MSNDNPFSESQFKTSKYQPDYPGRFESIVHARQWYRAYVDWYNLQHPHSGLASPRSRSSPADIARLRRSVSERSMTASRRTPSGSYADAPRWRCHRPVSRSIRYSPMTTTRPLQRGELPDTGGGKRHRDEIDTNF
ncbi:integrase core domain-containing protein [Halomonas sp. IOP_31]|uniref:integrase core domain-containing protein n=1 Tax=Halomonas sp. IOP_31 TaxID=2876584 RepID=UPI003FA60112